MTTLTPVWPFATGVSVYNRLNAGINFTDALDRARWSAVGC
jgi:hypothetical protein